MFKNLLEKLSLNNLLRNFFIFLVKLRNNLLLTKYQTAFFKFNEFNDIIIFLNKKIYSSMNYFLEKKIYNPSFKKLKYKFSQLIIFYFNRDKKLLSYQINKKNYAKLLERNSINFLKINLENANDIKIKKNKDGVILRSFYIKKKSKKKLVLLLMLDGMSSSIAKTLNKSKIFFKNRSLDNCWANAAWTLPSYGNLITGRYTSNHRCYKPDTLFKPENEAHKINCYKNIYEFFSEQGFVTGCYSGYRRINPTYGYTNGVDIHKFCKSQSSPEIIDDIIGQLEMFNRTSNFIFAHLLDAHHLVKGFKPLSLFSKASEKNLLFKNFNAQDKKTKNIFKVHDQYHKDYKLSLYRYSDSRLQILYNYINKQKYDDFTIILFGDHGTRFSADNITLSKQMGNVGFFIKDKKIKKINKKKIIQTVDIFPSFFERYGEKQNNNIKNKYEFDGINSLFSSKTNKYVISESLYWSKYELAIRAHNLSLYNRFKLNESLNTSNGKILHISDKETNFYNKNNKIIKIRDNKLTKKCIALESLAKNYLKKNFKYNIKI